MDVLMCQSYSLNASHPLLPPLRPQSKSERGKQILHVEARKMVLMNLSAGKE